MYGQPVCPKAKTITKKHLSENPKFYARRLSDSKRARRLMEMMQVIGTLITGPSDQAVLLRVL